MAMPTPKPTPAAKAKEVAAKLAQKGKPAPKVTAPAGSISYKQYEDMKKKGTYKGFDGMNGVKGKGVAG